MIKDKGGERSFRRWFNLEPNSFGLTKKIRCFRDVVLSNAKRLVDSRLGVRIYDELNRK